MQVVTVPGAATPLHTHAGDEVFFVLSCTGTFDVGRKFFEGGAGSPGGIVGASTLVTPIGTRYGDLIKASGPTHRARRPDI